MDKYIYGCARYFTFVRKMSIRDDPSALSLVDSDTFLFSSEVGLTLEHDFDRVLTTTDKGNLDLYVTSEGIFFRYKVIGEIGERTYRKVKNFALRHCSTIRQLGEFRRKLSYEERHLGNNKVFLEKGSIFYEICLTNGPAHSYTFCTVHKDDKRLKGVNWDKPVDLGTENHWEPIILSHKINKELEEIEEIFKPLKQLS